MHRQNRFALRYGLPVLRVALAFCVLSILLTLTLLAVTWIREAGWFDVPRERL